MNYYTKLASDSLEHYLKTGNTLKIPDDCPKELLKKRAGCFVSYHKSSELRGCIGTFLPTKNNLAEEIVSNSIAASHDPRFRPISQDEISGLSIKVDILTPPEKTGIKKLDPKIYGVIVKSSDGRAGLLLPDLEGVNSVKQQIEICRQKAGISLDEEVELYRFRVKRYEE